MKTVVPNYYKKFHCIAEKCQHSCCIGWEIDIDSASLERYNKLEGDFGKRVRSAICHHGVPHFELGEGERCPFLNGSGLCDMIVELGKQSLCNICADHPRFRNFFERCTEMGIGICCEEACRVVLEETEKFQLDGFCLENYTPAEQKRVLLRQKLVDVAETPNTPLSQRHNKMLQLLHCSMPQKSLANWCKFYLTLERLDDNWTQILQHGVASLQKQPLACPSTNQLPLQQLTIYFLFRHFFTATTAKQQRKALCFAILSANMVANLHALPQNNLPLWEIARMYSAEIEYSTQNVARIFAQFR